MVYYIIACDKEGEDGQAIEELIKRNVIVDGGRQLGDLYTLQNSVSILIIIYLAYTFFAFLQFNKQDFKIGQINDLMEVADQLTKNDIAVEASLKRNEGMYTQLCKDLNEEFKLNMEIQGQGRGAQRQTKDVIDYIQGFKWDSVKFQMDK